MTTRVALADDHRMFRHGLRLMLETEPEIEIVGEADDGLQALALARDTRPDVVCMDVCMPGMNGIEATRHLHAADPAIKVIGLSAFAYEHYVLDMLKAGALGYVTKTETGAALVQAIRAVQAGKRYLCPELAANLADSLRHHGGADQADGQLAPRERQVLHLIADGCTSPEIAQRLHLAASTVEVHRRNIMRKLGLHSVAELTKYAIRNGIASAV